MTYEGIIELIEGREAVSIPRPLAIKYGLQVDSEFIYEERPDGLLLVAKNQ
jgi:hypothetical protein